jgi:hypothetical protein
MCISRCLSALCTAAAVAVASSQPRPRLRGGGGGGGLILTGRNGITTSQKARVEMQLVCLFQYTKKVMFQCAQISTARAAEGHYERAVARRRRVMGFCCC